MTNELVVIDAGGTHVRFALASISPVGDIALGEVVTLKTGEFACLEDAWAVFARSAGDRLPAAVSLAIAGPLRNGGVRMTNGNWTVHGDDLRKRLALRELTILNDFAAVAHAVASLGKEHFLHLAGPEAPLPGTGTTSVIGPGTGLGVAHFLRDAGGYHVQATEGGHVGFAPADEIDDRILHRLRERFGRVSVERVLSGPGIVEIHAVLADGHVTDLPNERAIWEAGIGGTDPLAKAAVERFCDTLGAVAGDYALAHGASAVVIAGGQGLRLREVLLRSAFAERFRAKGRYEGMMAAMPVRLVTHPQPGLYGAAAAFARDHC